jgi:hypothetical protein
MPCHAMHPMQDLFFFWKVFHKYYNSICALICTKFLFLQKVGVTDKAEKSDMSRLEVGHVWKTSLEPE